ncbi:TetR/AcrR family transcriptional regulator [Streptomyces sp. NPDC051664]|uniref:TetR/AcrR family transcriptional regulator n=1 Tax=Streptomyces sp. NPDC051664 TaxID=3365668 RepID=UPI0037AB0D47
MEKKFKETPRASNLSPRERLLLAADELFYAEGIYSVGIDRILAYAGVAKSSLYSAFGSKEELIKAYLTRRHEARRQRLEKHLAQIDTPRERILAVFDVLGRVFAEPGFRGCAFLNASAESVPGTGVAQLCDTSRAWVRNLFEELGREAGVQDPAVLSRRMVMLYDGSSVAAQLDRDLDAAAEAREIAVSVLDAALAQASK